MYGRKVPTENEILEKLDPIDIFDHYIDGFEELGNTFCSELREDNNPSCAVHKIGDRTFYKDFGTGETLGVFSYIKQKYECSYTDALRIIYNDLILGERSKDLSIIRRPKSKKRKTIKIKPRSWNNKEDKNYWSQYHLNTSVLNYFDVIPIEFYTIGEKVIWGHPMYAFKFDKGVYKIMRPYSDHKWVTNAGSDYYQGYNQLPWIDDHLIITSSMKDVMVLYKLGFNAIAPQSETQYLDIEFLKVLKDRFDHIFLLLDNDDTGIKFSRVHYEQHGIPYDFIDNYKDPSDLIKNRGVEFSKEHIECKLQEMKEKII